MYLVQCAVTNSVDVVLQHLDMKMQYRHSRDAVLRHLVITRRHNSTSMDALVYMNDLVQIEDSNQQRGYSITAPC